MSRKKGKQKTRHLLREREKGEREREREGGREKII
jgi:hypothetical protein